jgi:hypothetical protein
VNEASFIIITTYGPHLGNENHIRHKLHRHYLKALLNADYSNFEVYLFGHLPSSIDGNINFINTDGKSKEQKLQFAKNFLLDSGLRSDYILRLDDDDILNPKAFQYVNQSKPDVYCDLFHTFINVDSGLIAQQKRPWIPNTAIMKWELAFSNLFLDNALLFNFQHTVWHRFVTDSKASVEYTKKFNPLYLRVLSSASITSRETQSKSGFNQYLAQFGTFEESELRDFKNNLIHLNNEFKLNNTI